MKKNAKRSSFPKKSSRILRKGNRLEQYQFIAQYHNEFGVRWLLDRFHIYPNSYYNYRKNRKAGYLADKEKKKQQILSIYYEYDRRPGYRMVIIFLRRRGIRLSRSKAGCPYDNSPMESFYGTFKSEFIRQNRFETDQELNESTLDYIYSYYNQ